MRYSLTLNSIKHEEQLLAPYNYISAMAERVERQRNDLAGHSTSHRELQSDDAAARTSNSFSGQFRNDYGSQVNGANFNTGGGDVNIGYTNQGKLNPGINLHF